MTKDNKIKQCEEQPITQNNHKKLVCKNKVCNYSFCDIFDNVVTILGLQSVVW